MENQYTMQEVATVFKVSTQTIRREIARGRLGCGMVGKQIRISESDIAAYRHQQAEAKAKKISSARLPKSIHKIVPHIAPYKTAKKV